MCMDMESRPGAWVSRRWWKQAESTLWGRGRWPQGQRGERLRRRTVGSHMTKVEVNTVATKYQ